MNIEYIEKNTDIKVEYHETICSTNERAKEIAEKMLEQKSLDIDRQFEKIQLVVAENQTNGKGTNGRVWFSDYKENILMTMIFYPQNSISELQKITYSIAEERSPIHKGVTIEQVGDCVTFLFSSMSGSITGQVIYADHGYNIMGI